MPASMHDYYRLLFINYGGFGIILCLYLLLGLFEITFPAEARQAPSGRVLNIFVTGLFLGLGGWLTKLILHGIALSWHLTIDRGVWCSIAIVIVYGVAHDFGFYWYHRAQHKIDLLWPIHELHHTETGLNATTGLRTYWLESPLQAVLITVPVVLIVRMDQRGILLLPVVFTTWLFFAHSNLRLNLGFLTPIICGPQVHRIHHSRQPEHQNKNFAQFFPCIDMLFGTYHAPRRDEFPPTGIAQRTTQASLAEITVGPLRSWAAALKGVTAKASAPPPRSIPARPAARQPRASRKRRRAR